MKKISELTPISGEIQEEDILVVNTAGGTRKITYAELCEAVKITLGIREVVESVNITEPGFLMDGQTASEALAQLNGNIEQLNSQTHINLVGEDLNNIKHTCFGYCNGCLNAPTTTNGYLEVISNSSHNLVMQKYTTYLAGLEFRRQLLSDGSWSGWETNGIIKTTSQISENGQVFILIGNNENNCMVINVDPAGINFRSTVAGVEKRMWDIRHD